jgi:GAF domain-containing protein
MSSSTLRFAAETPHGLQARLDSMLSENRRLSEEHVTTEERLSALATRFAAVASLHEALDESGVILSIQEVVANLVGSEQIVLLDVDTDAGRLRPVASSGVDAAPYAGLEIGRGPIGGAGAGRLYIAPSDASPDSTGLTAAIPLTLGDEVIGVLAIFLLLPQRAALDAGDRELLELLGTHAARALLFSRLYRDAAGVSKAPR